MPIDKALLDTIRANIGIEVTTPLGQLSALAIRRYARAIGEGNPLYYDADFARCHGYTDIVAPPNMITAITVWDEGPATDDLRADGTPETVQLQGLPETGVRVMGAGAVTEFHAPVVAGTTLVERSMLAAAELVESRNGPMIVVTYRHEFVDQDGRLLVTSNRKALVR